MAAPKTSFTPRPGNHVVVRPTAAQLEADEPHAPGIWWVVSAAPETGHWWLAPKDAVAQAAVARFGKYVSVHSSHLAAAYHQLAIGESA